MKRIQPQESSPGQLHGGSKGAFSELSQSMMDLSVHKPDKNPTPVPRFQASVSRGRHAFVVFAGYFTDVGVCLWQCFDPDSLTSTIALMKKRNEDLKPSLYRTPKTFVPRERPRSSTYALDWRRPQLERHEDLKMGAKKWDIRPTLMCLSLSHRGWAAEEITVQIPQLLNQTKLNRL